jgi:quercetin dioxygenase-like cupin family protein
MRPVLLGLIQARAFVIGICEREESMLTRRGFAACALCAVSGFVATAAEAQTGTTTPGLKRTILQRTDGPAPGYETVIALVEIEAGTTVARHTHPGIESAFIVEGKYELLIDGQPSRIVSAGQGFQVPAGAPHSAKNGDKVVHLAVTFVVEKGKPLASPA